MIVTQSPKMEQLIELSKRVAASTASVLITGESGTGKELLAQLIHDASPYGENQLVRVNCAALSSTWLENELFGFDKRGSGEITGRGDGGYDLADGGSIFLDEVSEIPPASQPKLLRFLDSKSVEHAGDSESVLSSVRIIASSNRDLRREVDNGRFRLDLYHRLNTIQIRVPPLRERTDDIPVLARHFMKHFAPEGTSGVHSFSEEAIAALLQYDWPGNVRELRNAIHRACVLSSSGVVDAGCLQLPALSNSRIDEVPDHWLRMNLADIERQVINAALQRYGSHRAVAQQLGVSSRTLTNKLRRYREAESENARAA